MDVQIKRGLLDVCVLSALTKENSYGYKIISDLSPYVEFSESTLYPILRRLESDKCLTTYSVEHSGRLRKYYSITDRGRGKITDFIEGWGEIQRVYDYITSQEESK